MNIALDHFFILTDPEAPQANLVSGIGLVEGSRNSHPGQGTANRRFFFSNSTLELLYIRDANEAKNGRGNRLGLVERHDDPIASPFGLIVRNISKSAGSPFPGWQYCPEYFRDDQCFLVGENSDLLEEPLCICMPRNLSRPNNHNQTDNPLWSLTELRISVPTLSPSLPLETISNCEGIRLQLNAPHKLELVFNEEKSGLSLDFRPDLPLIARW